MPSYNFHNTFTNETETIWMAMSEYDDFVSNNPHLNRVIQPINIADPVSLGITLPPADFRKNILGRIRDNYPGSEKGQLEKRWSIPREV